MYRIKWPIVLIAILAGVAPCPAVSQPDGRQEQVRFEFWKVGAFQQRPVTRAVITINEPFDIRSNGGAIAAGLLRRTVEGGLHFKGEVSHAGMSASFDAVVDPPNGVCQADKIEGGPDSDGYQSIFALFSLSHVQENVSAGLGLGASGKQDQLLAVPGPQPEHRRPSEWFQAELERPGALTADRETWLLFRSKQLDANHLWIERIDRTGNSISVAMAAGAVPGDDHFEIHGVNLGQLPAGTYEVEWLIRAHDHHEPLQHGDGSRSIVLKGNFKVLETSPNHR